jgi:hypothetical protein
MTRFNCVNCKEPVIDTRQVVPNHYCSECEEKMKNCTLITIPDSGQMEFELPPGKIQFVFSGEVSTK